MKVLHISSEQSLLFIQQITIANDIYIGVCHYRYTNTHPSFSNKIKNSTLYIKSR